MIKQAAKATTRQHASIAPARVKAFEILLRVAEGSYASNLLATVEPDLESRDRVLCYELVMGVLRYQLWLDRTIEHFAERSVSHLDLPVVIALRLGLYQLRFLTRIPQSAAVNESVKLMTAARVRSAGSFVNAVLRRSIRESEYDPSADIKDRIERLAVKVSHPLWLIDRWSRQLSMEEAEALAVANNQPAPLAFRIVDKEDGSRILEQLRQAGAQLEASELATGAWRIQGGAKLAHELAQVGQIYFQDEASQLVAQVVDPQVGERVLDVCAAPGSKTTQIAATARARVVAGDIYWHRIETVRRAADVQGLMNISCLVLDAESVLPFGERSFDRVLVDAPCSGTGTLRHNPEIRWRISAGDIKELSNRQQQILTNAAVVVRPGGRLIYSTCSLEPEENEAVVADFVRHNRDFEPAMLRLNGQLLTSENTARTWPHRQDTDGFFIAAFMRKGR